MACTDPLLAHLVWLGDDAASRGRNPDMVNEWTRDDLPYATERDKARRELDTWKDKWLDTYEALHQARTERDEAEQRYRDTAKALTEWHGRWVEMERERDEWRAHAEAAEARTAPAVTKRELRSVVAAHDPGDDELAVSRVNAFTDRLWSLVSGADPVEDKARELAKAGGADFDEQEPEGVEMLMRMARHVLGQEAGR